MLSLIVFLPLIAAAILMVAPAIGGVTSRWIGIAVSVVELILVGWLWLNYQTPEPNGLAFEEQLPWMPGVNTSYHVGVDGLALPLVAMTVVIFLACAIFSLRDQRRPRQHTALFLFLQCVSLGLFVAADLILFFVFFDLSIVGMYFVIATWGQRNAVRSARKFFLYTFLGSLALLLGFIGLYVTAEPHTFDIIELVAMSPVKEKPVAGSLILAALVVGLAIKTPTIPFHTWLPPAHTDAPATGSAVLAGVLLKMGTYGFVRIAMPILPATWRSWAWGILLVGLVSVLYGALVALAQTDLKRMIAYTSVNHMGYIIMALGAVGLVTQSTADATSIAVTGAVVQMVSHGLITAALFLLTGVMHTRTGSYQISAYGGLAATAPRYATVFGIAAFASLGIPGLSGFIAEFQIFAGSIAVAPVTAFALPGILITAALFLRAIQRVFTGPTRGLSREFNDITGTQLSPVGILLGLSLLIGVAPQTLLSVVEPASTVLVELIGG